MLKFNKQQVQEYSTLEKNGTGYLAYRDLEKISRFYQINTGKVLDLGCGTGDSTECLQLFCDEIVGVDISPEAIQIITEKIPGCSFYTADVTSQVYPEFPFTAIFSVLMLFHLSSELELKNEFQKCYLSLQERGHVVVVNGTKNLYTKRYASVCGVGKPPECSLDHAELKLEGMDYPIIDIFWREFDVIRIAEKCGLTCVGIHYPLGEIDDNQSYVDEYRYPPYFYIVLKK